MCSRSIANALEKMDKIGIDKGMHLFKCPVMKRRLTHSRRDGSMLREACQDGHGAGTLVPQGNYRTSTKATTNSLLSILIFLSNH